MRSSFVIALFVITVALHSQDYTPFDFQNGIWITKYDEYQGPTYDFQYYCDGDTIIDQQIYFKLFQYSIRAWYDWERTLSYYGGIANDTAGKRVILIKAGYTEPKVLYNFDLEIGDTIKEGIGRDDDLVVISIDSVLICDKYHKRYSVKQGVGYREDQAFIEGIGYSFGFVEPLVIDPFEMTSDLICYTEKNNESCEECELLLHNQGKVSRTEILVYPNPANSRLAINTKNIGEGPFLLLIYNEVGCMIETSYNTSYDHIDINVEEYNPGIYFYELYNTSTHKRYWGKLIVN